MTVTPLGIIRVAVLGCLLGLTGCVAAPPSPSPTGAVTPGAEALPTPEPMASGSTEPREPGPTRQYQLGDSYFDALVDGGPRDGARGSVTRNADGELAAYTVVSGDGFEPMLARFGIEAQVLINLNAVRRDSPFYFYAGDIVNLDPHTITSVGTENGRVAKGELPDPAPAQR